MLYSPLSTTKVYFVRFEQCVCSFMSSPEENKGKASFRKAIVSRSSGPCGRKGGGGPDYRVNLITEGKICSLVNMQNIITALSHSFKEKDCT
jgi:hypothetical protein